MKPKYYFDTGYTGGERTLVFATIADAIFSYEVVRPYIRPVPNAHGKEELSDLGANRWWVFETYTYPEAGERPSTYLRGEFRDPVDAFEFAEMKVKKETCDRTSWHVEFVFPKKSGCLQVLEKFEAMWLTKTRKARDKARRAA